QGRQVFDVSIPFIYQWDGLAIAMHAKSAIEDPLGPWLRPRLGAPLDFNMLDLPDSDFLILGLVKLLGLFSSNWVVVLGALYLVGFGLCATTAYLVMRRFGIAPLYSFCAALLFTFLPYH